ncbi:MAG: TonB-dependent receptor [Candidatus Riflebacteria bacterium]|nr:TonB-dependent receptor [Candidatus Riflebacteria bacterium]
MKKFGQFFPFRMVVIVLYLFPKILLGQNNDLTGRSLESLLNVPIIAASAMEEKPSDSPATAYVVSEETILNRGYNNLLDLLEDIPEIEISQYTGNAHGNTLTIQGVNGDRRFQVMIDGIQVSPVTGNLYSLGRQFSLKNAKQVEIVLGPVSALYGANVFTGAINIVTKTGREMDHDSFSSAVGSNNSRDFSLTLGKNLGNDFKGDSVAITAHQYSTNGPNFPKNYPDDFSWYNNEFQSGRMLNSPGSTAESAVPYRPFNADEGASFVQGRFNGKDFELGFINMNESHSSSLGMSPAFAIYDKDAVFKTEYTTLYGKHSYTAKNNKWNLHSLFSHQIYELVPQSLFLDSFSGYKPAYKYGKDTSDDLEEKLSINLGKNRQLLLGLTYQKISSLPRTGDLPYPFDPNSSADSQGYIYPGSELSTKHPEGIPEQFNKTNYSNFGGYSQLQLQTDSMCNWTLGARYDSNSLYGATFNPRVGLVLKPHNKVNIKFLFGTAFLAPPPDKIFEDFGSFVVDKKNPGDIKSYFFHISNPNLKPEKTRSTQTEFTYSFDNTLRLTLNGYDSWISNIQQVVSLGSGTYLNEPVKEIETAANRGNARTYGGTIRLDSLQSFKHCDVNSFVAFTYSNGDLAGEPLPFSSRTSIKAGSSLICGKWTFSPRLIHQARSFSQTKDSQGNYTSSPPFSVINLYIKHSHSKNARFLLSEFLNLTNLTDARYYTPDLAGGGVGFTANPQEPRTITGGITVEF